MKKFFNTINLYFKQFLIYTKRPLTLFDNWAAKGRLNWTPDKLYLTLMFRSRMGYWMNWKNPKTFNEKLQWLKIHARKPLYTKLVDKFEVRKYITEKIGDAYLIPLLGVWDTVDEIDFEKLPNQFVLKCTHDSGSTIICQNKKDFDLSKAKQKLKDHLRINYYYSAREFPYKNVKHRIIAEPLLDSEDIIDYKFQCFNSKVENGFVCTKRRSDKGLHVTFFDRDWNILDFKRQYPKEQNLPPKPKSFQEMINIAKKISKGFTFLRVDFYEIDEKPYIGELTLYPGAGFEKFDPPEWDFKFGELLDLNNKM